MLKFLKPFSFVPALVMMYLIFSFSSQDGITSSQLSYKISYKIVEAGSSLLGEEMDPWEIDSIATRYNGIVRKIAHMGEYFLLAVAVAFPLYVYGLRGILLMIVAGLFCVAFACGDEYHQSFTEGRSPSRRDVLIDSFGVFWGIILVRIIGWTGRKTIFRPFGKKRKQQADGDAQFYGNASCGAPRNGYQPQTPYGAPCNGCQQAPYGAPQNGYQPQTPYNASCNSCQQAPYGAPQNGCQPQTPYNAPCNGCQQAPYGAPQYVTPPVYQGQFPEDTTSDRLSEDMSLKKLVKDLKEQKKEGKKTKTPKVSRISDTPEIHEIDLDDP